MTTTPAAPTPVRAELFGPDRRATTLGVLLLITLVAFEAMGVGTAMPALVADLGALSLYAWPFVAFQAAAVFSTVVGGRWCDRAGPRVPLVAAPLLFGVGLTVAGTATTMAQLLVGRVLQGLGAGALTVAVFVLIAAVYSEGARPAVFGMLSSAWVLPTLVGPPVAGIVTEALSWHWVFLGLLPFVVIAVALVLPAVRGMTAPERPEARSGLVVAALGAALGVSALSWAGQGTGVVAIVVAVVAIGVLVPSLRRLLPGGVALARRGIPALVLARGLMAGVFFTLGSYLPLMLHATHGWSLAAAGLPLITGALSWSLSSAWQARHPDLPRPMLVRAGFVLLTVGAAGLLLVAPTWGVPWLALGFWAIAGVGMGVGTSALSFLVLQQSAEGTVGFNSSAAQIADQLTTVVLTGAGGALLVLLATPAGALPLLVAALAALALLGVVVAGRTAAAGGAAAGDLPAG